MKPDDYRKKIEADLAATGATAPDDDDAVDLDELIARVADDSLSEGDRQTALASLEAAAFADPERYFAARAQILAALRQAAQSQHSALREAAMASLAQRKDRSVQRDLIAGLRDPQKAKLSASLALQLLGHDIHAEVRTIAREILRGQPDEEVKLEALRLLASDGGAGPEMLKLLRDRGETREVRQLAASALRSLDPASFKTYGVAIVEDEDDDDEVRANVVAGLAQGDDFVEDDALRSTLRSVETGSGSAKVRECVKGHLDRTEHPDAKARVQDRRTRRKRT